MLWEAGTTGIEERQDDGIGLDALRRTLPGATVEPTAIPEVDWVARFRENFHAFEVGPFWIAPAWERPDWPVGKRWLGVEPGRAFGTGTHESTALCLRALATLAERGTLGRTLDVGTGSGILAIAATLLGATPVVASDFDPESMESARAHIGYNDRAPVRLVQADGGRPFRPGAFDTVVANITAPLLIERAAELSALPAPAGRLLLAGLLAREVHDVRSAYSTFPNAQVAEDGEWAAFILERS
jgi:ribosomal protein L11 methyltransferase